MYQATWNLQSFILYNSGLHLKGTELIRTNSFMASIAIFCFHSIVAQELDLLFNN